MIYKANYQGRPVISSDNCRTSKISEFVHYYLQTEVKKLKSYLKILLTLLRKLKLKNTEVRSLTYFFRLRKEGYAMGTK